MICFPMFSEGFPGRASGAHGFKFVVFLGIHSVERSAESSMTLPRSPVGNREYHLFSNVFQMVSRADLGDVWVQILSTRGKAIGNTVNEKVERLHVH